MNDELTTRLARQLHEQADDWQDTPLTLDGVRGKARSIRRRRAATAVGVAAVAVLAITLPLGLSLGRPGADEPGPVAPTPTEAVEPTPRADGTFPLTIDVGEGEVPQSGFLVPDDEAFVTPAGAVDLPGRFWQLLPYDGGWVGTRATQVGSGERMELVTLDADFREVAAVPAGVGIAASSDGSRVAWMETAGSDWTVVNAPVDGGAPIRTAVPEETAIEGFLAPDVVATSTTDFRSGEISYGEAGPDGLSQSTVLSGEGTGLVAFQDVRGTSDASGLVAGQTEFRGDSTCSQVRDAREDALVAETCEYGLGELSPDGRWVIGYASYYDFGSPTLAILDALTLEPVVEFTAARGQRSPTAVLAATWDDDDTLVALVEEAGEQAVLRAESNGALSRISDVVPVRDMSLEFALPADLFGQG